MTRHAREGVQQRSQRSQDVLVPFEPPSPEEVALAKEQLLKQVTVEGRPERKVTLSGPGGMLSTTLTTVELRSELEAFRKVVAMAPEVASHAVYVGPPALPRTDVVQRKIPEPAASGAADSIQDGATAAPLPVAMPARFNLANMPDARIMEALRTTKADEECSNFPNAPVGAISLVELANLCVVGSRSGPVSFGSSAFIAFRTHFQRRFKGLIGAFALEGLHLQDFRKEAFIGFSEGQRTYANFSHFLLLDNKVKS
jgi:hypothetical protein